MTNDQNEEINRLEDQQLENLETKRAASVMKIHDRLEKIKRIRDRDKKGE